MENRLVTVALIAFVVGFQSNVVTSQASDADPSTTVEPLVDCNFHDAFYNTTTNECDCIEGFVMSTRGRKCLPVAKGIESFCTEDQQCLKSLGVCTSCQSTRLPRGQAVRRCLCASGYNWSEKNSSCVRKEGDDLLELVQSCQIPIDCDFPNGFYNTTTKQCDCSDGYVIASKGRECLPVSADLGDTCSEDQQCTKSLGACTSCETVNVLKNGKYHGVRKCVCRHNYYWSASDNACILLEDRLTEHSEDAVKSCPLPITCTFSNGFYNDTSKQCDCVDGYILAEDRHECLPVATEYGVPCKEDQQCQKKLGVCTSCQTWWSGERQCVCAPGYEWVEENNACEKLDEDDDSGLVESCQMPISCGLRNGYYNTTTKECDCLEGYVMSSHARKCLPVAAESGANCEEDQQCTKSLGVCTSCEKVNVLKNGKYHGVGMCVCGKNYYWSESDNACILLEDPWRKHPEDAVKSCPLPITCTFSNGFYNDTIKQCDCVDGYVLAEDRHKCLPVATEFGDECKEHQQCHQNLGVCTSCERVSGRDGKWCHCAPGYQWVEKNKACERPEGDDDSELVRSCRMPMNCKLPNGYYNSTTEECTCLEGYVMARARRECLPAATALGSPCTEDRQCHKNLGHSTVCESRIKRTSTRMFMGAKSVFRDNNSSFLLDYEIRKNFCLPISTPSEERKCVCAIGYYLEDDTCRKLRVFRNIEMNKCQNDEECSTIITGTECDKEKASCRCNDTMTPNGDHTECVPLLATGR